MQYGGMPLAVLEEGEAKRTYLKGLFETTYFRDIVERNHPQQSQALEELRDIVSAFAGRFLNAGKLADTFRGVRHGKIGESTVQG